MYVSWVFYYEGYPLAYSTRKGFAYTPSGAAGFRNDGLWIAGDSINPDNSPPASVVFYYWPSEGRIAHVGIVQKWTSLHTFYAYEGNTNGDGSRDGGAVELRHRHVRTVGSKGGIGLLTLPLKEQPIVVAERDDMILVSEGPGHPVYWLSEKTGTLHSFPDWATCVAWAGTDKPVISRTPANSFIWSTYQKGASFPKHR